MNRIGRTRVLFTLLIIMVMQVVNGQGIEKEREYSGFFDSYYHRGPLSFTGGIGTSLYKGDVAKGFYGTPCIGFSLGANYKVWPRVVFGAEFQYFSLAGKSASTDSSGSSKSFTSSNWGINLYGRLYLIEDIIRRGSDRRTNKKIKPYITAGLGFIRYNSVGHSIGSASGLTPVFPVGLGIECKISSRLQIIPEFTQTFTLTDKLDGAAIKKGSDGYGMLMLKVQYSPFAPKKKKKASLAPAEPNQQREEHQEWRKKKEEPKPPVEEEHKTEEENKDGEQKEEGTDQNQNPDAPKDGTQENTEEKPTPTDK
ncbi:MAG TPA: DUF6089 family protein [Cytophagaceae bacterium]|jgi:opacity protein-like surface antigen|nr:DUF6089 family protein [Cytophagaceae bacterium]